MKAEETRIFVRLEVLAFRVNSLFVNSLDPKRISTSAFIKQRIEDYVLRNFEKRKIPKKEIYIYIGLIHENSRDRAGEKEETGQMVLAHSDVYMMGIGDLMR